MSTGKFLSASFLTGDPLVEICWVAIFLANMAACEHLSTELVAFRHKSKVLCSPHGEFMPTVSMAACHDGETNPLFEYLNNILPHGHLRQGFRVTNDIKAILSPTARNIDSVDGLQKTRTTTTSNGAEDDDLGFLSLKIIHTGHPQHVG
jgi:hypothetical protein